ncbi:MAG: winged helix-turn-helix domain-containing protein [Candidatus Methanospirareceae archaeon]
MSTGRNFSELAARAVKERILEILNDEQPLNIAAVTARLGVSRPTCRKYLSELAADGTIQERRIEEGGLTLYSTAREREVHE